MQSDAIWLFDSQCVLCSQGVQYTLRHEKAATIQFVAIQSDEGRALARHHDVDPDDPATFLFIEGGTALEKSDAMIALAAHLKGPVQIARIFAFLPRSWRDNAYGLIARNRYKLFGQVEHCIVPRADQWHRFVL